MVVGRGRVGDVAGILVGILYAPGEGEVAQRLEVGLCFDVYTLDVHLAEVEHRPTELLSLGVCHNLVFHGVVVAVGLYAHMAHDACCPRLVEY